MQIVQQYLFEFYGSRLPLYWMSDRRMYLPLRELCRAIGINAQAQKRRIQRNPAMQAALVAVSVQLAYGEGGAVRAEEIDGLWIERFHYWLGSIDASRVGDPAIRQRLILYQREAADALWALFRSDLFPPEILAEMDTHLPIQRQHYLQAADDLAGLRRELSQVGTQISGMGQRLEGLEGRLQSLEARFIGTPINPQQQSHLKEMLSAVAAAFYATPQGREKGRGGCAALSWHDFYCEFHIANYPELPAEQMGAAQQYLAGRYRFYAGPQAALPEVFRRGDQPALF